MFSKRGRNVLLEAIQPTIDDLISKGESPDAISEKLAKALDTVIPGAVDKSADAVVASLHRRVADLNEHRKLDRAFKRRLARTWRKPFLLYEMILTCAVEIGADFDQTHRPRAAKEGDFRFDALTMLHARACLVAAEAFELLKGGYPHGAHSRCRTLHELAVFAGIVGDHDQEVTERFLSHSAVEDAAFVNSYQRKIAGKYGYEPYSPEEVLSTTARSEAAIKRFGKGFGARYGWAASLFPSPPSFGQLEELAGLDHLRPFYDWATHLGVHASSRGARLNIVERGQTKIKLAGRTNAFMADPGHGALISLMQVTASLLLRGRPIGADVTPLIIATTMQKLTDQAGDAFLAAHDKLEAKEQAFQAAARRSRPSR
jgi:Family of unknown function (DUF5677)